MEYFKTDRHGTKYYLDFTCNLCKGVGCWKCGQQGKTQTARIVKKYTPEYRAKLDEIVRRRKAGKALAAE